MYDSSVGSTFGSRVTHTVLGEQPQICVQPTPTPSIPTETPDISGLHHTTPNLLFYPILDIAMALARHAHTKVIHPASQNRVNDSDNTTDWLRSETSKDSLCQDLSPLFSTFIVGG